MSSADSPLPDPVEPVPERRGLAERVSIVAVVVLVTVLVLVAVSQTIGVDVNKQIHRWTATQKPPVVPAPEPFGSFAASDTVVASVPASMSRAADAQISPPRRKRAARAETPAENVEPVAPIEPAAPPPPDDAVLGLAAMENMLANIGAALRRDDAPTIDATEGLLQTAAQLVTLSWQDFAYPVKWAAAETSKTRMVYTNHRSRLLKAIAHTSPSSLSLESARKDYAAARAQFDQDPRLDYAFGLVLWKHEQYSEAIEMFQTAARLDGTPFLPAALAVAWGRFLNRDEHRGLDQLDHVSRVLAANADLTTEQRIQATLSMGRALGYLSGPGQSSDLAERVELTAINVRKRLPENLRESFDEGKRQTGERLSDLAQLAQVPEGHFETVHRTRTDELQNRVDEIRQEMRDARNEVTRAHQSHVDKIKDVLKEALDIGAQIEKVQPKVKELMDKVAKLNKPESNLSTKTMPGHYHLVPGSDGYGQLVRNNATFVVNLGETSADRAKRISELTKAHEERKKIDQELSKLREQQKELVAKRHEEDRNHKVDRDLARKERVARLDEQRQLEEQLQSLNKALRRTMILRDGIDTIAAYIPWNVEVEGEALRLALTGKSAGRASP